jgi:hypothetical protein
LAPSLLPRLARRFEQRARIPERPGELLDRGLRMPRSMALVSPAMRPFAAQRPTDASDATSWQTSEFGARPVPRSSE